MQAAGFLKSIRGILTFERTLALIFLLSLIVRLAFLDLKLFHHDEAVHAWFSWRLLTEGVYQYDPCYHGPVLYYVTGGVFAVLGDSDFTARLVPAILGALLIPLLVPIYRLGYLDRRQTLVAALFLALSPELIYFSRFLRNDIFIVFFTLLLLVALLLYFERGQARYAVLAGVAAALGLATKENMPIVLGIFGLYLIWLIATRRFVLPRRWPLHLIAGAAAAGIILVLLYSSFFQHPEIALTWWQKAITHWWEMHSIERIAGPPYFYIILLLLYEAPLLILAIYGTAQFIVRKKPSTDEPPRKSVAELAAVSLAQLRGEVAATVKAVCSPTLRNYEFTRFCIVWMLASLAAYAYIGEKVPWLVIHQILPMIFVAVYCMSDKKMIWVGITIVFFAVMTAHVAFTPADINEPIVQVQNSEDLREVFALIDASNSSAIVSNEYWPIPWYYRGGAEGTKIVYHVNESNTAYLAGLDYGVIIAHDGQNLGEIEGYEQRSYALRYWFSTWDNINRIPQYYFFRDGPMGRYMLDVYVKKAE